MIKKILFLLLTSPLLHAQNLVPNPSFEDTVECPMQISEIQNAKFWFNCGGTPDYFNACNPDTSLLFLNDASVPNNWIGFQYAATGDAYAGILSSINRPGGGNDKEYVSCRLQDTLQVGVRYYFSFKV